MLRKIKLKIINKCPKNNGSDLKGKGENYKMGRAWAAGCWLLLCGTTTAMIDFEIIKLRYGHWIASHWEPRFSNFCYFSFFFFFTLPVLTTYILMATASLIHASCGYSLRLGGSNNRNGAHGPLGSSTSFSCSCCSSTNLNFSSGNWSLSSLRCSFLFFFFHP